MLNWLKSILIWIKRIFRWLWSGKFGLCVVFSYPLVFIISWFLFNDLEAVIRISGMVFQLLGLATVAIGILGISQLFSSASIFSKIKIWVGDFPKFRQNTHTNVGRVISTMPSLKIRGHMSSSSPENSSLEERVAFLENTVKGIDKQIYQVMLTIEDNDEKVTKEIQSERTIREESDDKIKKLLKNAVAGDLILEEVGLIWLFFGIVFASASKEISCWLI